MYAPKIDALSAFVSLYYAHYADPEKIKKWNILDYLRKETFKTIILE